VPQSAIVYEGDAAHVWVVRANNEIVIRPIRVGRTSDGFVEILEGLQVGERVVTQGSLFIDRAVAGS
jgi:cobalt-zinc-cadmium efflux system membrane fusion protein